MKVLLIAGLEISFVPAATFKAECGGRNLLPQLLGSTFWAICQRVIADFLQRLQLIAALLALVFIDWHGINHQESVA